MWLFGKKEKKERGKKSVSKRKRKAAKLTTAQRFEFAANHGSFGVIITAVMLIVTIATAAFIYTRPILEMDRVRASLDAAGESIMNTVFKSVYERDLNVGGYMNQGEQVGLQAPTWRKLKVASVRSRTSQPIYLRYRTTVDLNEEGWSLPDQDFQQDLQTNVEQDFVEYNQYYCYLATTSPSGDPLEAGLDAVDSEEEGYIMDFVTVYPKYKVSDLLGIPQGTVTKEPTAAYVDYDWEADTLLRYLEKPRDRSYMFQATFPVFSSNVFLTAFNNTQKEYINLRRKRPLYEPRDPIQQLCETPISRSSRGSGQLGAQAGTRADR